MLKLEPREAQSIVTASDTRRSKGRTQRLQGVRPTMQAENGSKGPHLIHDESVAYNSGATVCGRLKTKDIDVVVAKEGIGRCLAVSMKGSLSAFRNLTNRLEDTVGDSKIHVAYPALVYGLMRVFRANEGW